MALASIAILALAADTAMRVPDGRRVHPVTQCFTLVRNGQDVGLTFQQIRETRANRKPAWDIVIHQRVGTVFDMRDHFVVAKADLAPVAFDNRRSGEEHVRLAYAKGRITGTRTEKGAAVAVDLAAPGPVWEGNLWGTTFGALPLAAGGNYTLPFYQYDKGFGSFALKVTGEEKVATPAGPVAAWAVDITADGMRHITYLIGKADGAELGNRAPGFATRLGGDCTGLD